MDASKQDTKFLDSGHLQVMSWSALCAADVVHFVRKQLVMVAKIPLRSVRQQKYVSSVRESRLDHHRSRRWPTEEIFFGSEDFTGDDATRTDCTGLAILGRQLSHKSRLSPAVRAKNMKTIGIIRAALKWAAEQSPR